MNTSFLRAFAALGVWLMAFGAHAQFEGKVTYQIVYESTDAQSASYVHLLPKEATLWVKGQKSRFEQALAGGGRQLFINNHGTGECVFLMTYFGQEFLVRLNPENLSKLAQNQEWSIATQSNKVPCLHVECTRAESTVEGKKMELLFNPDASKYVFLPQFPEMIGLPMKYSMIQNGVWMHFEAQKVSEEKVSDLLFAVPNKVRELSFEDFARNFAVKL
jgi:hypothetical protein